LGFRGELSGTIHEQFDVLRGFRWLRYDFLRVFSRRL